MPLKAHQKGFVDFALEHQVLRFGEFTLKSGRKSPYFFNAGLFKTGAALCKLGEYYADAIVESGVQFDTLFGPAYKGIPLVATIAIALFKNHNRDVPFSYNRKEVKDHGEGGQLVGEMRGRVLIVDDVITAGTAVRESVDIVRAQENGSCEPAGVAIAMDRQEKVSETSELSAIQSVEKEFGFPVVNIVGLSDLLTYLEDGGSVGSGSGDGGGGGDAAGINAELLERIREYRQNFGVKLDKKK